MATEYGILERKGSGRSAQKGSYEVHVAGRRLRFSGRAALLVVALACLSAGQQPSDIQKLVTSGNLAPVTSVHTPAHTPAMEQPEMDRAGRTTTTLQSGSYNQPTRRQSNSCNVDSIRP